MFYCNRPFFLDTHYIMHCGLSLACKRGWHMLVRLKTPVPPLAHYLINCKGISRWHPYRLQESRLDPCWVDQPINPINVGINQPINQPIINPDPSLSKDVGNQPMNPSTRTIQTNHFWVCLTTVRAPNWETEKLIYLNWGVHPLNPYKYNIRWAFLIPIFFVKRTWLIVHPKFRPRSSGAHLSGAFSTSGLSWCQGTRESCCVFSYSLQGKQPGMLRPANRLSWKPFRLKTNNVY